MSKVWYTKISNKTKTEITACGIVIGFILTVLTSLPWQWVTTCATCGIENSFLFFEFLLDIVFWSMIGIIMVFIIVNYWRKK